MAVITGASKRDRTAGLRFTRAPLYQLSYAGVCYTRCRNPGPEGPAYFSTPIYQEIIESSTIIQYEYSEQLKFLVQDVCEKIIIDSKIDFIIHAASQASPKFYGKDPVGTINANVIGTINLLELAKRNKVEKFLYFSSSEVYGNLNEEDIPTKEDKFGSIDPCNVRSCYSEGKRAGETICISWKHQYSIPVVIVRPFHTYGPGMDLNDGRVYADFIKNIVYNV